LANESERVEPEWVVPEGVISLNQILVQATGEPHSVLNQSLLESACSRPKHYWAYGENDIAALATHLLFGIAKSHPFLQGNKRTAFTAMIGFIGCNGYALAMVDGEGCADHIISVLADEATEESFTEVLRQLIHLGKPWNGV